MQQRSIKVNDIINCINNGQIIECYIDDEPFPSCLILGRSEVGNGIHVVCAIGDDSIWIVTAYYPDKNEWLDDLKTRR
jgi:hypothetical protein